MSHTQDILDIADEAIICGEKVCNGANIHDMRVAISQVQFWRRFLEKNMSQQLLEVEGVDDKQQLLGAYILHNKDILRMDKKGNILGFITHEANVYRVVAALFTQGKIYKTEEVNYGSDKQAIVHEFYAEKVKHLVKPYCVGGIGDNYWTEYLIVNEANVKALNELGFREWDEVVKEKLEKGEHNVWASWITP